MALVRKFTLSPEKAGRPQSEISGEIYPITVDGETFLQIKTFGTTDRDVPGQASQNIRLSAEAIDQIIQLAARIF